MDDVNKQPEQNTNNQPTNEDTKAPRVPLAGQIPTPGQPTLNARGLANAMTSPTTPGSVVVKGHTVLESSPIPTVPNVSSPTPVTPTPPQQEEIRSANPLFISNEPTIPYNSPSPTPQPTQPAPRSTPATPIPPTDTRSVDPEPVILAPTPQYAIQKPDPALLQKKALEGEQLINAANQMQQKLAEKEALLNKLQEANQPHKNELQSLHTESKTIGAVIQNLRQQFNNLDPNEGALQSQTIEELQQKIKEKEQQSIQLEGKINALHQSISQEQQLANEVENYRQQIRELVLQQQKIQEVINQEEQKLNEITRQLNQQVQETQNRANQIKQLEEFLNEAILNTAHQQPEPQAISRAQFMNPNEIPVLTQKPNAINGVVKDQNGKLLPDAVVMIKDAANHNLRAMKSNKLGQFVVTTPLVDGQYYIEVSKPGFTFTVVEVKLEGGVLPPIEVIGHETTT